MIRQLQSDLDDDLTRLGALFVEKFVIARLIRRPSGAEPFSSYYYCKSNNVQIVFSFTIELESFHLDRTCSEDTSVRYSK